MAAGRHTKYRPEMLDRMIELYAQGKSDMYVAARLGINRDTFYDWKKKKRIFSDTVQKGHLLAQAYHEDIGQALELGYEIDKKTRKRIQFKGNGKVWAFIMANRFKEDYSNRPEPVATTDSLDAIREAIQSALGGGK